MKNKKLDFWGEKNIARRKKEEDIVIFYLALDIDKQLFSVLELLEKKQKWINTTNKQILFSLRYPEQLKKIEENILNNKLLSEKYEEMKKNMNIDFQVNASIRGRTLNNIIFVPDVTGMIWKEWNDDHDLSLKTILTRPWIDTQTWKTIPTILMFDHCFDEEEGHWMSIEEQIDYLQNRFINTDKYWWSVVFEKFYNSSNLGNISHIPKWNSKLAKLADKLL